MTPIRILVFTFLFTISARKSFSQVFYGIEWSTGDLYAMDLSTKTIVQQFNTGFLLPAGLAFSPDGNLYFFDNAQDSKLWRMDLQTQEFHWIADLGHMVEGGLAVGPTNKAWCWGLLENNDLNLVEVDLATGNKTIIGPVTGGFWREINGIAYRYDGMLVGVDFTMNMIIEINPTTGVGRQLASIVPNMGIIGGMTMIGDTGFFITAGPGILFGGDNELWEFDAYTGAQSLVTSLDNFLVGAGFGCLATPLQLKLDPPIPGMAGVINSMSYSGATPTSMVLLAYGFQAGTTTVGPPCSNSFFNIGNAAIGAVQASSSTGTGTFQQFVSPALAGRTVYLQGLDLSTCIAGNLVLHSFP